MVSAERVKEIGEVISLHGDREAQERFSLSEETLSRYKRQYRKLYGNIDDIIARMRLQYNKEELEALVKAKEKFVPAGGHTEINFEGEEFSFLVMSDTHIGSKYTQEEHVLAAIEEGNRQHVDMLIHPGDVTEGMSGRDGHIYELTHIGYKAQRAAAIELFKRFEGPIKMISGNHDLWFAGKANMGGLIVEDICDALPDAEYLGEHEAIIDVNGAKIMAFHGEDGASYATSYRSQKIIESLEGGEKPAVLLTGHDHKQGYFFQRNVHCILSGGIQRQTPWMRRKKLAAHCGFWIIKTAISNNSIKWIEPRWYPFYR